MALLSGQQRARRNQPQRRGQRRTKRPALRCRLPPLVCRCRRSLPTAGRSRPRLQPYLFRLAEALRAAGVAQGLDPDTADALTRQTLLGAATLLASSGEDPGRLRENVTSKGGTTAAGLAVMDSADFMGLIDRVVDAATRRSRELGQ